MKKWSLAICDKDPDFSIRFMSRMNRNPASPFLVRAFTAPGYLLSYLTSSLPELLLVCPEYLPLLPEKASSVLTILLSESRIGGDGPPAVFKYRSAGELSNDILLLARRVSSFLPEGESPRTAAVFSCSGRCGKTRFSLMLARLLSRQKPVLLLSLDKIPILPLLTGCRFEGSLSDLFYCCRETPDLLPSLLSSVCRSFSGVDLLPPPLTPGELEELTPEEWRDFFRKLQKSSAYSAYILDLGSDPLLLTAFSPLCSAVYMPRPADPAETLKNAALSALLQNAGASLPENLREIALPPIPAEDLKASFSGELFRTPAGQLAEQLIREDLS